MWIPDPVYEALPPIYGVAGIAAITYSMNVVNLAAGLTLIGAGVTIWWIRKEARRKAHVRRLRKASKRLNVKL